MDTGKATTIDEYIRNYPKEIQAIMNQLRATIREASPKATEKISWGMATFDYYGNLVHFAGEKKHIGFHPAPSAIIEFQNELKEYHTSKGTVRFPYDKAIPYDLIKRMVQFRTAEQESIYLQKEEEKRKKRSITP